VQLGSRSIHPVQEHAGTGRSLRSLGAPLNAYPFGDGSSLRDENLWR
jgi:hypothetical protein